MNTFFSYFTQKSTLSTASAEGMAEGSQKHASNPCYESLDDKSSSLIAAFQVIEEFINEGGLRSVIERQRMLESELKISNERLARLSEDHARSSPDNSNQNSASSNLPSVLERNYRMFYDHQMIHAIDCINKSRLGKEQNKLTEIEDRRVACLVFEESFAAAQSLRESSIQGISWILTSVPSIGAQYSESKPSKSDKAGFSFKMDADRQSCPLDQISVNCLKVIMKETSGTCNISVLVQKILSALRDRDKRKRFKHYTEDFLDKPEIQTYVEECCRYAWQLVCQTPPYVIRGNSEEERPAVFDPAVHQVCIESVPLERSSRKIDRVVWPGLFEGSSGRIIRKTEVALQSQ